MAWHLDSTRIFVTDWQEVDKQIVPRLQPLGGGSVTQMFGYENTVVHLTALVVGNSDKNAVKATMSDAAEHVITGPYSISGSYVVSSVQETLQPAVCQTIREDLDPYSPVYQLSIELFKP